MKELLKKLKERCGSKVRLTEKIDFRYDEDTKTVHMTLRDGITENMQENSAAFEGWALAFKANLSDLVEHLILDWDSNAEPLAKATAEWRHFNRFLYRLNAFESLYGEWFSVANPMSWEKRIAEEGWGELVLNSPGQREEIVDKPKYDLASEHSIEEFFVGQGREKLKEAVKKFKIKLSQINNQYPVGVFNEKVSRETYVFTGGKSAIDLYSIAPGDSFNIFELKAENNVQVGVVSELFFYATLIKDLLKGKFRIKFTEVQGLKKVNAFFLAPRLHPLITSQVLDLLNQDPQVSYYKLLYEINSVKLLVS